MWHWKLGTLVDICYSSLIHIIFQQFVSSELEKLFSHSNQIGDGYTHNLIILYENAMIFNVYIVIDACQSIIDHSERNELPFGKCCWTTGDLFGAFEKLWNPNKTKFCMITK